MMKALPPTVARVLGEEASSDFVRWFDDALQERTVPRDEYRQVLSRLDIIEHDLEGIKDRLESMEARSDARFESMEEHFDARFDAMQRDMNARFDAVNARIDTIHDVIRSQTRWLVATLIALGGLISVLLTIFEFIS